MACMSHARQCVDTWNPFALVVAGPGHSGGEPPRDSESTDRLSRSSVGSFMFFASEWFQDCFSVKE